jgi:predicted Zn-dependent peptidase
VNLNRTQSPPITEAINMNLALKPYEQYSLDNGVPVYAIQAGAQDVLLLELVFDAGNWYEDKNIIAASTNFLLKNGTKTKTAYQINEEFDYYGAYLNRNCFNENSTISLHTLSKHLEVLLPSITDILTNSIFPEQELKIYKQNQLQRLQVNLKKCDFVANRLIDEYVYGFHHPYGKYTSTADYEAVDLESIKKFFDTYYIHGNCKIFISGKLPPNFLELLNKAFGSLPLNSKAITKKEYHTSPAIEKKYRIVNDENGVQSAIRLARPFINRHHPNFVKCQVLNNVFGGFFGSRLMSNIREDKGYTYGIHSFLQNHIQPSAWVISTEAGKEVTDATIEEVYKEMEILKSTLIDEEELSLVKNYMLGTLLGDIDGPFQIMGRWKSYILNNLPNTYFNQAIETIKTVTAEELQLLAQQYLNVEEFYELTVV